MWFLGILYNECVNIWKICMTQWTHNFQWPMHDVIKLCMGKSYSKIEDRLMDFDVKEFWRVSELALDSTL